MSIPPYLSYYAFTTVPSDAQLAILLGFFACIALIVLWRKGRHCVRRWKFGPQRGELLCAWEEQCISQNGDSAKSIRESIFSAERIFLTALKILGFERRTPMATLSAAGKVYREIRKVDTALRWAERLRTEPQKNISKEKHKEILKLYRNGLRDLGV